MTTTVEDAKMEAFQHGSSKENIASAQKTLLHAVATREGFTQYEIETNVLPSDGSNYLGIVSNVTIAGRRADSGRPAKEEKLHLFVKVAASGEELREKCQLHEIYCNEMFVYKVLSRRYMELQTEAGVPEEELYRFVKFYGSIDSERGETIVLENLSFQGYTVQDRFQCVTLGYAQKAVAELAKFHALSYVLERRDPDYFERALKTKKGNLYLHQPGPEKIKEFAPMLTERAAKNVRNPVYVDRVRRVCTDMFENITNYVKVNKRQVLCHGDFRGNNLLVKYEEGQLKSIVPIDYQLIYYGSPIYDLLYFIFVTTDSSFRSHHLAHIKRHYRQALRTFLRYFSLDVEDVYPENEFEEDFKSHMMLGLVLAVHLLPFILASTDKNLDLDNLDDSSLEGLMQKPNELYLERFNEIVEEFVQCGYI